MPGPGGLQYGTHVLPESDLIGKAAKYLLVVEMGGSDEAPGRILRFATEPLTITDRTGRAFDFRGGLQTPDLTLGEGDVSVALVLDSKPEEFGWLKLFASGTDLEGAKGLLLQWADGLVLERARVLVSGVLTAPAYGDPEAPDRLEISLESIPLDSRVPIVDPDAVVLDGETWPVQTPFGNFDNWATGTNENLPRSQGLPYPKIIGRPRWSPALLVERQNNNNGTCVVADGHCVSATGILWDRTGGVRGSVTITPGFDRKGAPVCTVNPSDVPAMTVDNSHEYVFDWSESDGGTPNLERTGVLTGGGELILWALLGMQAQNPYLRVDVGRCQAARQILDGYRFDAYAQGGDYMAWLRTHVLKFLPVELVEGPGGWYPLVWRWGATLADKTKSFVVRGPENEGNCTRIGPILRSHTYQRVVNRFVLEYRVRDFPRPATRRAVLGPRVDARSAYVCRRSKARFGGVKTWTSRAQAIDETATARKAVEWRALRDALPRDVVGIRTGLVDGAGLERGDVVSFADETGDGLGTEAAPRVGLVTQLGMVDQTVLVGVELLQTGPVTGTERSGF